MHSGLTLLVCVFLVMLSSGQEPPADGLHRRQQAEQGGHHLHPRGASHYSYTYRDRDRDTERGRVHFSSIYSSIALRPKQPPVPHLPPQSSPQSPNPPPLPPLCRQSEAPPRRVSTAAPVEVPVPAPIEAPVEAPVEAAPAIVVRYLVLELGMGVGCYHSPRSGHPFTCLHVL